MEKTQFKQILKPDDLIAYNCYVATKRSKSSIMTRVLGVFLIVLGIVDLFKEDPQYLTCILVIAMGVFGALILNPLMLASQKKMIRKRISAGYPDVPMDVRINEEGITFEIPLEEEEVKEEPKRYDDGDIHTVTPIVDVPSDNEMREEEYHANNEEAKESTEQEIVEVVETDGENVEEHNDDEETVLTQEETKPQTNVLPIPWAAIKTIEDDGIYMYINMAGYQSMIIKKSECETIEEVVAYCKEKLSKPTHYIEKIKKENDHE